METNTFLGFAFIGVSVLAKGNIMRTQAAPAGDVQEQQATE